MDDETHKTSSRNPCETTPSPTSVACTDWWEEGEVDADTKDGNDLEGRFLTCTSSTSSRNKNTTDSTSSSSLSSSSPTSTRPERQPRNSIFTTNYRHYGSASYYRYISLVVLLSLVSFMICLRSWSYEEDEPQGGSLMMTKQQQQTQNQYISHTNNNPILPVAATANSNSSNTNNMSWMEHIVYFRQRYAEVAHELKKQETTQRTTAKNKQRNYKNGKKNDDQAMLEDMALVREVTLEALTTIGLRGLLFDVLAKDLEYYIYQTKTNPNAAATTSAAAKSDEDATTDYYYYYEEEDEDDDVTALEAYHTECAGKHGVGPGCHGSDVWWLYHYVGMIITDQIFLASSSRMVWDYGGPLGSHNTPTSTPILIEGRRRRKRSTGSSSSTTTTDDASSSFASASVVRLPLITSNEQIPFPSNTNNRNKEKNRFVVSSTTANEDDDDDEDEQEEANYILATVLDQIHTLQATLPYVNQASFHTQHAIIWRWYVLRQQQQQPQQHTVEDPPRRNTRTGASSSSVVQPPPPPSPDPGDATAKWDYPWDLAVLVCRGDGTRPHGLVGTPVNKGIDHECFHGFGHAMFYAVATQQYYNAKNNNKNNDTKKNNNHKNYNDNNINTNQDAASYMVFRPNSGFELTKESYCTIYHLCLGASPKNRATIDPKNEARANSYRICLEGVIHSVRLLASPSQKLMRNKASATSHVTDHMTRCRKKQTAAK